MLAKRIIACLDMADGRVVKGTSFSNLRDAGDPVELGKLYSDLGVDELVFLDINATVENRSAFCALVKKIAKKINIPFTVGGGIRGLEDIKALLSVGADKISIGTAAVKDPSLIKVASQQFGAQCIVVSIDPKQIGKNKWEVFIYGGRQSTGIDAIEFAKRMEELGAGELLVNSIDRDGQKSGYDLELTRAISREVGIPVIASSGAGRKEHFLEVFTTGCADAALAASLFHFQELEVKDLKKFLIINDIPIRL